MGKSLYIQRLISDLETACSVSAGLHRIVTLHGPDISIDKVVKVLSAMGDDASLPIVLHLDVSERVSYRSTTCIILALDMPIQLILFRLLMMLDQFSLVCLSFVGCKTQRAMYGDAI